MRIQKTHKRYISSVVAGLMVTAITLTGFSYNDKTVTVMADGAAHTVKTHLNSNEGIVRNAGIKLNPKDKVISDSNSVQEGTTLTVVRAFPVSVTVNGKTRTVYTTQTTAEDLAEELGFKAPNYTTAASGAIQAGSTVNIVRVTSRAVNTVDQEIPVPAVRGVVAVDPDVIPLGTRLFIPGYGEAVAADTGGAIVGNRIDLVMDSYGEAMDFGRRDVTVYVLD